MRYPRTCLAAFAAVAVSFALLLSTASAHAGYKRSIPATAEVVQTPPAQVEIFFTQSIQKVGGTYDLQVEKDRGPLVTSGPAVLDERDRSHLSVPLRPNLAPGRYVVNWKNVSDDDGDPVAGAFSFYVRTQPNAVDLQNDQQLAKIGAGTGVTPAATPGSTAASSGTATTPGASGSVPAAAGTRANPTAVGTATSSESSDGGGNRGLYVLIAIAVAAVLAAAAAYAYRRRGQMRP